MSQGLREAVALFGSQGALASEIGYTQAAICHALKRDDVRLDIGIRTFVATGGKVSLDKILSARDCQLVKQAAELLQ